EVDGGEGGGAVESLALRRGPADGVVLVHRVEVHAPLVADLRGRGRGVLREGDPGDRDLDVPASVLVALLVERAVDLDGALELRVPIFVTEGAVGLRRR